MKFAATIREATGSEPDVPERFAAILDAPRHVTNLPNDAEAVKKFIKDAVASTEV